MKNEIEDIYKVNNIKWKQYSLWPLYKPHLYAYIRANKKENNYKVIGKKVYKDILKTFFKYFFMLFKLKNYDFWIFTSTKSKIFKEKLWVCSSTEKIYNYHNPKVLAIESNLSGKHQKPTGTPNMLSEGVLLVFQTFFYLYFKFSKPKFEGEEELEKINSDNKIAYNYKSRFYRFLAQYYSMKLLLMIKTPKISYFVCYYTYTGYIIALKEKGVKVVEVQHGIINDTHLGYNYQSDISHHLLPDNLFSFGDFEKNPNNKIKFIKKENICPVGSNLIDIYLRSDKTPFGLEGLNEQYKCKIIISGDGIDELEKEMVSFINKIAKKHRNTIFMFVPRNRLEEKAYNLTNENIVVLKNNNIYELLKWADIHMTMYSTTAIESLMLGTPTILYNYKNFSKKNYKFLIDKYGVDFCDSIGGFDKSITKVSIETDKMKLQQSISEQYKLNYNENLIMAIKKIENKIK